MKAIRVITAQGFGNNTTICDIREVSVTNETLVTNNGYIQRTLGTAITNAIAERNKGAIEQIWLEIVK